MDLLLRIRGNAEGGLNALRAITGALRNFSAGLAPMGNIATRAGSAVMSGLAMPARSAASILDSTFRIAQQSATSLISTLTSAGRSVFFIRELAQSVTGLASSILQPAINAERTQVAFTGLFRGATDQASAFLAQLRQFAEITPFEFPQLTGAAQRLLAVGFAAQDVIPTMRAVGDSVSLVGGGAAEVDRVVSALTQMQTKGKVTSEEMLQIAETNVPAFQALALGLGVTTAELQNMLQKGLSANQAIPALVKGLQEIGNGQMQAQSQTMSGLLSTMADKLTSLRTTLATPLFDLLKPQIDRVNIALSNPALQQAAFYIGQGLAGAVQLAISAFETLGTGVNTAVVAVFGSWQGLVTSIAVGVGTLAGILSPLADAISSLMQGDINAAINLAGNFVSVVASILLTGIANLASDLFGGGANVIASFADGLIAGAARYVTAALNYITSLIASFLQGFSPPKVGPLSTIDTWFPNVLNSYLNAWPDANWGVLEQITGRIADTFEGLVESGAVSVDEALRLVVGTSNSPGLTQLVADAVDSIRQTGKVSGEALLRIQSLLGSQFADVFDEINANLQAAALNQQISKLQAELEAVNAEAQSSDLQDRIRALTDRVNNARSGAEQRAATEDLALARQQKKEQDARKSQLTDQLNVLKQQQKAVNDTIAGHEAIASLIQRQTQFMENLARTQERVAAGGGGGGAGAQEFDRAAKAARDYAYHISDNAGKLAILRGELAGVKEGSEEWHRINQQIWDLEQQQLASASQLAQEQQARDKARTEAAWQYNYALADAPGKLAMLREKLASVEEGSEEWYRIQGDILGLTREQEDANKQLADKASADAKRRSDAEFDYKYQVADSAGKLALLRQRLSEAEEGSEEYWQIKQQIAQVEASAAKEAEAHGKKATAGAKNAGGAAKGAIGSVQGLQGAFSDAATAGSSIGDATTDLKTIAEDAKTKWGEVSTAFENARARVQGIRETATGMWSGITDNPAITSLGTAADSAATAFSRLAGFVQQNIGPITSFAGRSAATALAFAGLSRVILPLSGVLGTLPGLLLRLSLGWSSLSTVLSGGVLSTLGAIVAVLGGPLTVIIGVVAALVGVFAYAWINNIGNARGIVDNFVTVLQGFFQNIMVGVQSAMPFVQMAFSALSDAMMAAVPIAEVVGSVLLAVLGGLVNMLSIVLPSAIAIVSGAFTVVAGVIQVVAGIIGGVFELIYAVATGNTEQLSSILLGIWDNIKEGAGRIFGGLATVVLGLVTGLVGGVILFFTGLWETLVGHSIIPDMVNAIIDWFTTLDDRVLAIVSTWVGNVVVQALKLYKDFIEHVTNLKERAIELVGLLISTVLTNVSTWVGDIVVEAGTLYTNFTTKVTEIKDKVIELFGALKDGALGKAAELALEVVGKIGQLVLDIGAKSAEFVAKGLELGKNIISSIAKGISDGAQAVVDAAVDAARKAFEAAKNFLGISSPSKLFTWIGYNTTGGQARGMEKGIPLVVRATDKVISALVDPFEGVNDRIQRTLGGVQLELQQTRGQQIAQALRATTAQQTAQIAAQQQGVRALDYHPEYNIPVTTDNAHELRRMLEQMIEEHDRRLIAHLSAMLGID